jgi:hypothetical protein
MTTSLLNSQRNQPLGREFITTNHLSPSFFEYKKNVRSGIKKKMICNR